MPKHTQLVAIHISYAFNHMTSFMFYNLENKSKRISIHINY